MTAGSNMGWFSETKAVDANGNPKVLYHGTKSAITEFAPSRGGEYGSGIYLTDDPGAAWAYAERAQGDAGQNIMPVYALIRNPFYATDRNTVRALGPTKLQAMGYDGIIATGITGERQYVVFRTEQVISALSIDGRRESQAEPEAPPARERMRA